MAQWWEALSTLQQVFLFAAVPFSLILLIQAIITVIGIGGGDTDADADVDVDADTDMDTDGGESSADIGGFRFFTIQGLVAFFCIFGWVGYALGGTQLTTLPIILIATVCGFLMMLVIGLMFNAVKKLQQSGHIRYSNAVGQAAEVYIPIPSQRTQKGKVMVQIQERLVEAEAITDEQQSIRTGETVRVVGKVGNTLIVKR